MDRFDIFKISKTGSLAPIQELGLMRLDAILFKMHEI